MAAVLLAGGHHQRRLRDEGVDQVAHAVAQAAGGMQIEKGRAPCRLCIAIRHGHRRGFLKRQDIADVRRSQQRIHQCQLGRSGIAENVLDAFAGKNFQQDLGTAARRRFLHRMHNVRHDLFFSVRMFPGPSGFRSGRSIVTRDPPRT